VSRRKKNIVTGGTALKFAWQNPFVLSVSLGLLQGKALGSEEGRMLGRAVLGECNRGTNCSSEISWYLEGSIMMKFLSL
jgi:hypothetical protein